MMIIFKEYPDSNQDTLIFLDSTKLFKYSGLYGSHPFSTSERRGFSDGSSPYFWKWCRRWCSLLRNAGIVKDRNKRASNDFIANVEISAIYVLIYL